MEWYKIIGSAEFLGNPIGLAKNLGSDVFNFFYEPAQALLVSPKEFTDSLTRGTVGLLRNTTVGVVDSAGKMVGALSKGLRTLSADEAKRGPHARPRSLKDGLAAGGKLLLVGIADGVAGVVMDPIRGARKRGVPGFVKGVGTGLVGVFLKPASGAVDLALLTLQVRPRVCARARVGEACVRAAVQGVSATIADRRPPPRTRLPRFMGDRRLVEYDAREAAGCVPRARPARPLTRAWAARACSYNVLVQLQVRACARVARRGVTPPGRRMRGRRRGRRTCTTHAWARLSACPRPTSACMTRTW